MKWTHKMHEIAVKTKQETLSMHVITIFTLIFLPGTFIAVSISALLFLVVCSPPKPNQRTPTNTPHQTFFSSGVLHWDDDGTLGSDWVVRGAGVRLFLSICLPLTVITIAIWAIMYAFARRWARRHAKALGLGLEGGDSGYADEKGLSGMLSTSTGLDSASQQQSVVVNGNGMNGKEKSGLGFPWTGR